jgi:hypothetical protein
MRGSIATVAALFAFVGSASAQDYPDLRGTWTGTSEAVVAAPEPDLTEGKSEVRFVAAPVEVVIDQQEGRRFTGIVKSETWSSNKPFVGVFGSEDTIHWAEPEGIAEARLLDSETLDYCYLRSADFMQLAACANLKRQK